MGAADFYTSLSRRPVSIQRTAFGPATHRFARPLVSSDSINVQPGQTFYVDVGAADGSTSGEYVFASLGPTPGLLDTDSGADESETPRLGSADDGTAAEAGTSEPAAKDAELTPADVAMGTSHETTPANGATLGEVVSLSPRGSPALPDRQR